MRTSAILTVIGVISLSWAQPDPDLAKLEKQRCPKPTEFAIVFSFGYAGDLMPKEDERFEQLLVRIKEGDFNTIHCTYTDKRLALCKKHGVKMMIDLLSEEHHHVYKSPDKAKAVCEKLRGDTTVWGYNIWNDRFAKTGEGRRRDVNTVRQWDPTHPAYSGTYRVEGMRHLENADILGYYDFHWKRGPDMLFPHLLQFAAWAKERDAYFYRWLEVDAGPAGKVNANRCLHSVNASVACGLKGVMWFLATELLDAKTLEWKPLGHDIARANLELASLGKEFMRLGQPVAIYATERTRGLDDKPVPAEKPALGPPGLEKHFFPNNSLIQPVRGEFLAGIFRDDEKRDYAFLVNHYAQADQTVELKATARTVELFDRFRRRWTPLATKQGQFELRLRAGAGELLRLEQP
jgi:hypothetical protein